MSERKRKDCPRCGRRLFPEPEGEELVPFEVTPWTPEGPVHWTCATLAEQRREEFQCERCGAQFHDDGRDSDAGWITGTGWANRFLCPNCQTVEEDRENTRELLDTVERGKAIRRAEGREYPSDLAALAESERERIARQDAEREAWERRLDPGG